MLRLIPSILMLTLAACPLRADPVPPDLAALLDIMGAPFQPREAVAMQLAEALPLFSPLPEPAAPSPTEGDLYFWSVEGRFGLPIEGVSAPGGLVTCARYGRITLDRLQELPSSDARVFPLMRQAAILHDDATAWPEAAVARLVCQVTWDDGRRVGPLAGDAVQLILSEQFTTVRVIADPAERPASVRVFGPGGYVIEGQGGPSDMVRVIDRAEVRQVATHQLILLRSYLLGGGA
ncbi:hypothetical protein [Nioella aestuarii]|uniref:hypothetical protein n=1 Tax=Nioella aestuarii TaxID=1662864 RepID=UPI003D7F3EB3